MRNEQDGPSSLETGNSHKVSGVLYGYIHAETNLEFPRHLEPALRKAFTQTHGRKVLMLEGANITTSDKVELLQELQQQGMQRTILTQYYFYELIGDRSVSPTLYIEAQMRAGVLTNQAIAAVQRLGIEHAINTRKLPLEIAHRFVLGGLIDTLVKELGVEIDTEVHPPEKILQEARYNQQHDQYLNQADNAWRQRDFRGAVKLYVKAMNEHAHATRIREQDWTRDLTRISREMTGQGGTLFVLCGAGHTPMITELSGSRSPSPLVTFTLHETAALGDLHAVVGDALRRGIAPRDEDVARIMVYRNMIVSISEEAKRNSKLSAYCFNWETISSQLSAFLKTVSLQECELICRSQVRASQLLGYNEFFDSIERFII